MTTSYSESSRTTAIANEPDILDEAAPDDEHTPEDESPTTHSKAWARRWYRPHWTAAKLVFVAGLCVVIALAGTTGWLAYRAHQADEVANLQAKFMQVASQGALNLTTIDWEHAEADVTRILDSASGSFYDDFAQRSQPFIEVVKQAKSKSVGSITQAGLESGSADQAQVLVAVNVTTTVAGTPAPTPRSWRMRVSVLKQGDEIKVSNVEFVP